MKKNAIFAILLAVLCCSCNSNPPINEPEKLNDFRPAFEQLCRFTTNNYKVGDWCVFESEDGQVDSLYVLKVTSNLMYPTRDDFPQDSCDMDVYRTFAKVWVQMESPETGMVLVIGAEMLDKPESITLDKVGKTYQGIVIWDIPMGTASYDIKSESAEFSLATLPNDTLRCTTKNYISSADLVIDRGLVSFTSYVLGETWTLRKD